jgi:hypothetical protein
MIDKKDQAFIKPRKSRKYWCKGCRNLFDTSIVPFGNLLILPNGDITFLCKNCAERIVKAGNRLEKLKENQIRVHKEFLFEDLKDV